MRNEMLRRTTMLTVLYSCTGSPVEALDDCVTTFETKVLPNERHSVDATLYGAYMAIDGNTIFVVDYVDDAPGSDPLIPDGAVNIVRRVADSWQIVDVLYPENPNNVEFAFGFGPNLTALSGQLFVPTMNEPFEGTNHVGKVEIFEETDTGWTVVQTLRPSIYVEGSLFGSFVAASGDRLVVGSQFLEAAGVGGASTYRRNNDDNNWTPDGIVMHPFPPEQSDFFGLDGNCIIDQSTIGIGASWRADLGDRSGVYYIFTRDESSWNVAQTIYSPDPAVDDRFGSFSAYSRGQLFISETYDDELATDAGAIHVFELIEGAWTPVQKIMTSDGSESDFFGGSIRVQDDVMVARCRRRDDFGVDSGCIYLFRKVDGRWVEHGKIFASDPEAGDLFGHEIMLSGNILSISAIQEDAAGTNAGAVYVYDLRCERLAPVLSVDATCPSGGPIRIEWTGAAPGARSALIYARNTGTFVIPGGNPCSGTLLGLGANSIQVVFQGNSDASGSRVIDSNATGAACQGYLQLLDTTTCLTSNVELVD